MTRLAASLARLFSDLESRRATAPACDLRRGGRNRRRRSSRIRRRDAV